VCLAEEEIKWLRSDFPPFSIPSGPYVDKGPCDLATALLIDKLDDYKNIVMLSNYKRTLSALKQQKKVGSAVLLKTPEREKFIEFSIPYIVLLPNGIVLLKSQVGKFKPYINKKGYISLEKTITESNLKAGISSGRKYSGIIDKVLKEYKNNENIYVNHKIPIIKPLLILMLKGRLDYILCYPNEARYYAKQLGENEKIVWLPLEGMPKHTLCYVGFPKNEWGKNIINKINPILMKHRNTPEFHNSYESWLDEVSKKRYREYAREFYLNE
jgi:uncharacterized protein (TIGR02285 family)